MVTEIIVKWNAQNKQYMCSVPEYAAEIERALNAPHPWKPQAQPDSEWQQKNFPPEYLPLLILWDGEKQQYALRSSAFPFLEIRGNLDSALMNLHIAVDGMLAWRQRCEENAGKTYIDEECEERVTIPEDVDASLREGWSKEQFGLFDWLTGLREGRITYPNL